MIRTPLSPFETFSDDPLRILRCIRFASRFGFKVDEEIVETAKQQEIQNALKTKVSHERIGVELDKMIKGPDPTYSIQLINRMNLYNAILYLPPGALSGSVKSPEVCTQLCKILKWILSTTTTSSKSTINIHSALVKTLQSPKEIRSLYLAAYLYPFKGLVYREKSKEKLVVYYLIHECLKQRTLDAKETEKVFLAIDPIVYAAQKNLNSPLSRSTLGMLICDYAGSEWEKIMVFVLAIELLSKFKELEMGKVDKLNEIIQKYNKFIDRIFELKLEKCYEQKHIIDGKVVSELLNIKGSDIRKVLRTVMEWQLENPEGTPEECKKFISLNYG